MLLNPRSLSRKNGARSLAVAPRPAGPLVLSGPSWTRLRTAPFRLLARLVAWQERAKDRAHLRALDDRLLRDVGLTRADVARETMGPFWRDPPLHRHPARRRLR